MALFDWFKETSNVEVANDHIWLTKEAKLKGISLAVARALDDTHGPLAVVLIAHFADCVPDLHQLIQQAGYDAQSLLVVMAENLAGFSTKFPDCGASSWIQVIV